MADKMTPILEIVVCWGGDKDTNETFEHYLKRINIQPKVLESKFRFDYEKTNLGLTSYETLDIYFTGKLLSFMCNGFDERLSESLNEIKKICNKVMHQPTDGAVDGNVIDDVMKPALNLLDRAGNKYKKG